MGLQTQFTLLLWKNFTLRKRQKVRLVVELLWPLFLFLILVWVRTTSQPFHKGQCHYPNKAMPSAGMLPWLQGMICNMENPCLSHPTPGETPGQVNNFNNSILAGVLIELQTLLKNRSIIQEAQALAAGMDQLASALSQSAPAATLRNVLRDDETFSAHLTEQLLVPAPVVQSLLSARVTLMTGSLRGVLCEGQGLDRYVQFGSQAEKEAFQNVSCSLSPQQLSDARRELLRNLDGGKLLSEVARAQDSAAFRAARELDFEKDAFGSLGQLICDKRAASGNASAGVRSAGVILAGNGSDSMSSSLAEARSRFIKLRFFGDDRTNKSIDSSEQNKHQGLPGGTDSGSGASCGRQNGTNAFCQVLVNAMETTPGLRYAWSAVKPLLRGKVLYAPDTPATRHMIKEANGTFDALGRLAELVDLWDQLGPRVWDFFQDSPQVEALRLLLKDPLFAALVDRRLNGTGWSAALLANFLYNGPPEQRPPGLPPYDWRDVHNATTRVLKLLSNLLGCLDLDKFVAVPTEDRLVSKALELLENDTYWAGIVFENLSPDASEAPPHVKYKIRMDIDEVEGTKKLKGRSWVPGARDSAYNDLRYIWGGFAYLQDMMDHGIVRAQTPEALPLGVYAQQMPYPCYVDDGFLRSLVRSFPLFITLAWIYSVAMTVKGVVAEKEARLKETLRIMGLRNAIYWQSWAVSSVLLLAVSALFVTLTLKYGGVLQYSDPSLIFLFLLVFCLATITQCFLISVFFSKANLAAACGGLIYFVLYLPYVLCYAWSDVMGFPAKVAVSILSCVAFGYGCENFAKYEQQGVGIQWSNMNRSPEEDQGYTFTLSIVMMLVDAALYWTLTWYIENVFPGQYGIPKPWYFPFTKSYWCGTASVADDDPDLLKDAPVESEYLEKPPPGVKAGISIRNLVKVYKTGKKLAVDGLSVDFYQNQITSFLGHNGAGKTTTMSILTGLFPPTSGSALICGYDIRTDMDAIRRYLGMCPQHNVLFNELTVEEHIYFYARLKGCSRQQVKAETDQMIRDVGLPHKRKELAKNLSGGMQRKLSVAIAFVGGSRVVVLDEPTAGVDPYARRGIWELLLKYKQGRTIILSTHHMDEADILGDRIAIISHRASCAAAAPRSSSKKCFGRGYYLTLVSCDQQQERSRCHDNGIDTQGLNDGDPTGRNLCRPAAIGPIVDKKCIKAGLAAVGRLVRHRVPEAVFLESIGQEITFILPYSGARDGTFAGLFQDLDLAMSDLGLTSYGIADTTLEEIFLKVAEDTGVDVTTTAAGLSAGHRRRSSRASERNGTARPGQLSAMKGTDDKEYGGLMSAPDLNGKAGVTGKGSRVVTGWDLIRRQFLALFIKRFHYARRSRKGLVAQVVLPVVFVCLALIFSLIVPPFSEFPSLELQPWMYHLPQTTFYSNDSTDSAEVSQVADALVNPPGFGTRCMMGDPIPMLPCSNQGSDWFTPAVHPSVSDIFLNGNWSMSNPSPSCQCSTPQRSLMLPDCLPGAGGLPPPQRIQNTTDTLLDLTGRNVTDFLVKTYKDSDTKRAKVLLWRSSDRYGGISVGGVNSQVLLNQTEIEAAVEDLRGLLGPFQANGTERIFRNLETLLKRLGTRNNVKVWFYNQAWHSVVSFLGVANNAILRGNLPAREEARRYGISVSNHPLNLTKEQLSSAAMAASSTDVVVSICVIFAMSFIPASFVLFLIQERVSKAKHLQFVSGVNPTVYWLANFSWDMCNYIIPCFIVVLIFLCFQQKAYVSPPNLPALVLLLLMYGWSSTPLMYPASFIFSVPSTAYVVLTCINLFIGINGSMATFVMELLDDDNIAHINDIVKQVLLIFPHFCLGRGLIDMAKNQAMATLFLGFGEDRFKDPLGWDMVGKNLCAMAVQGAVMFAVTILIQYRFFCKPRPVSVEAVSAEDEDADVARERRRVQEGGAQDDLLRVCDLTKVYPRKSAPAVDGLCVGVPAAECFGLLGINGAGKTTTFKMLTGDIPVSSGEAFLNGYSIRTQMREVHQNLGYCPQFDAIDELLTGREHLEFYARLRGVPENEVAMVAEWGVQKLGLVKYATKPAGTYSGGNKRKLSTAIALIGCPPVIFLDEPTTGMDPKARRFLWDCILSIIKEGRSVVLTSHSMEECEALCTRMAIMVNGRFKCLGSVQHLKSRFGDGYTVVLRVGGCPVALQPVEDFVQETFAGGVLKEKHHNTLQYQLPSTQGALADIFHQLAKHQRRLAIEDYSVSQTTLDQVFVNFAKQQHAED
uniref:P-type phospholipid transporter n=1 Tax=Tetraodon nigroviridis TaxID=99883 RepID=H3C1X8_TETNG